MPYDINPGVGGSSPSHFCEYNGKLYFNAQNATSGYELFSYAPATNLVSLVSDINTGSGSSSPSLL